MNKLSYQYAIVQFLPYAETGEFANIGVVLACPQMRYLGAKLAPAKRTKRVTDFFAGLDAKIYRDAVRYVERDLHRASEGVLRGSLRPDAAFAELIRPRQTLIRCGNARALLDDARHPSEVLDKLYGRFIERDFATKEYHEELLNRQVGQWLKHASLKSYFDRAQVGDETYSVPFPFVSLNADAPRLVIKPLHLAHEQPSKVLDHGTYWLGRIERLKKHGNLPNHVLFAVDKATDGKALNAAEEIVLDLEKTGISVVSAQDQPRILEFAQQARAH